MVHTLHTYGYDFLILVCMYQGWNSMETDSGFEYKICMLGSTSLFKLKFVVVNIVIMYLACNKGVC